MGNLTNSWLSSSDVCKIIETSSKNGVSRLKFESLEVSFGASLQNGSLEQKPVQSGQSAEQIAHEQETEEKNAIESDELKTREDQIAELLISDPLLAEEMMRMGELIESEETEQDDSS